MADRAGAWWKFLTKTRLRRRRRLWRFVSPRRHRIALGLLVVLLGASYAYWYFTNDVRVGQQAEKYLEEATGLPVRIGRAHFSLFGGLELSDVRIFTPADNIRAPIVRADRTLMRLDTWGLLGGHFRPTS